MEDKSNKGTSNQPETAKMNAITKKEIQAYANQTYRQAGYKHSSTAGGWVNKYRINGFISDSEVEAEAIAMHGLVIQGLALKPSWMD
jgi:hypothetical protein